MITKDVVASFIAIIKQRDTITSQAINYSIQIYCKRKQLNITLVRLAMPYNTSLIGTLIVHLTSVENTFIELMHICAYKP